MLAVHMEGLGPVSSIWKIMYDLEFTAMGTCEPRQTLAPRAALSCEALLSTLHTIVTRMFTSLSVYILRARMFMMVIYVHVSVHRGIYAHMLIYICLSVFTYYSGF